MGTWEGKSLHISGMIKIYTTVLRSVLAKMQRNWVLHLLTEEWRVEPCVQSSVAISHKTKNDIVIQLSSCTPGHLPGKCDLMPFSFSKIFFF